MCDYNFGAVDVVSFVVAAISLVETTKDIYSWGVCEYGSEGGGDVFREDFYWPSVVGVQVLSMV